MRATERLSLADGRDKADGVGDNSLYLLMVEGREGLVSRLEVENPAIVPMEGHGATEYLASLV